MSLFTIDISNLLWQPVGSVAEFQFEQDVPTNTWEDLICDEALSMHIKLVREAYGVNCILRELSTIVSIVSEGIEWTPIHLEHISREFHLKKDITDTDDIEYIDTRDATIDLIKIIEQELLIAGL